MGGEDDELQQDADRAALVLLSAAVITTCAVLIVDLGVAGSASVHATLNLPMLSSKPCIVILAAMPLLFASTALALIKPFAR